MKDCENCLLLGNARVYNIRQLREHFDTDIVFGYLLGGVLEDWLFEAGEKEILYRVRKIDLTGDIASQLEFIFGVKPDKKEKPAGNISAALEKALAARKAAGEAGKGGTRGGSGGSFSIGSFRTSSFTAESGSFSVTSFSFGSGRGFGYGFGAGTGSGRGSFGYGSGFWFSGSGGSFNGFGNGSFFGGSFRYYAGSIEITAEEYRRTLINLSSCPLNEYGYGIHLV